MCHQSVGLIQSVIEKAGISTVSITVLPEITRQVGPPRALFVDAPFGYPMGQPHDAELQREILLAALQMACLADGLPALDSFHARHLDASICVPSQGRTESPAGADIGSD